LGSNHIPDVVALNENNEVLFNSVRKPLPTDSTTPLPSISTDSGKDIPFSMKKTSHGSSHDNDIPEIESIFSPSDVPFNMKKGTPPTTNYGSGLLSGTNHNDGKDVNWDSQKVVLQ
jgi:hypothetical protein